MNNRQAGRRVYPSEAGFLKLAEGDYGQDGDGVWWAWPPGCPSMGCLINHDVTEHPSGTISVAPSILLSWGIDPAPGYEPWHGYLESGVWKW